MSLGGEELVLAPVGIGQVFFQPLLCADVDQHDLCRAAPLASMFDSRIAQMFIAVWRSESSLRQP